MDTKHDIDETLGEPKIGIEVASQDRELTDEELETVSSGFLPYAIAFAAGVGGAILYDQGCRRGWW